MTDDKEQETLLGFPVIEVDMPEMKDVIIVFGDWSNLTTVTNFKPIQKRPNWLLRLWAWLKNRK